MSNLEPFIWPALCLKLLRYLRKTKKKLSLGSIKIKARDVFISLQGKFISVSFF